MTFDDIAEVSVPFDRPFFKKLPKTDLHVHLDGSLRLKTIMELAEQDHIDLGAPTIEDLEKLIGPGQVHGSLEEYLKSFATTLKVLQTDHGLYRAAYELAEETLPSLSGSLSGSDEKTTDSSLESLLTDLAEDVM